MCPSPQSFRELARQLVLPSYSMASIHNDDHKRGTASHSAREMAEASFCIWGKTFIASSCACDGDLFLDMLAKVAGDDESVFHRNNINSGVHLTTQWQHGSTAAKSHGVAFTVLELDQRSPKPRCVTGRPIHYPEEQEPPKRPCTQNLEKEGERTLIAHLLGKRTGSVTTSNTHTRGDGTQSNRVFASNTTSTPLDAAHSCPRLPKTALPTMSAEKDAPHSTLTEPPQAVSGDLLNPATSSI
ncbi:hypothetical protein P171DRAFT_489665 [Karstenula rhodostoma CBS 690.94]|uniref:Uncharacterized protein n=1 Tax=Karstenula rhodostoma CBS 690.94 TaxID=1392251 RepID=A0A9P4PAZ7_9PLEO|nr:hypothetical protein P171DRAFT_489665 [Karstenula rhodostoma CBS 690.94]